MDETGRKEQEMDVTDYSKCSLCGNYAVGGIEVKVVSPKDKTLARKLCPQCLEIIAETVAK